MNGEKLSARESAFIQNLRASEQKTFTNGFHGNPLSPLLPGIRLVNDPEEENQMIESALDVLWKQSDGADGRPEPKPVREIICMVLKIQIEEYRRGLKESEKEGASA